MKPSSLRPGDRIRRKSSHPGSALIWRVLRLERRKPGRPPLVFMTLDISCEGEPCSGECYASAGEVARYFEQVRA
jgi:hypothetical protein